MKIIISGIISIILILCITYYYSTRPQPTDPLAQRLRETSTIDVQKQLIKQYQSELELKLKP